MKVTRRIRASRLLPVMLVVPALLLGACGSDDEKGGEQESRGGDQAAAGADVRTKERAFLEAMTPHHESAVAMTEVAAERAESPEIKKIATGIAESQEPEIKQMQDIHQRLFGSPLVPNPGAHEDLGLSPEEAGAGHDDAAAKLETANPFDRAFVDEMVPHHEGAIRMAEAVLAVTQDAELKELAQGIVDTQKREIEEMNSFRTAEYGGPVPEAGAHGGEEPAPEGDAHGGGHEG